MAYDAQHGVNVAECLALADFLEELPAEQFDIRLFGRERSCGTVACIAGWQAVRAGRWNGKGDIDLETVDKDAACDLGLSEDRMRKLFNSDLVVPSNTTPLQAARVLRHLAATGEVDWGAALEGGAA